MMKRFKLFLYLCFYCFLATSCGQINDVTGSFAELETSGRIQVSGVDTKRFFRFHLRQFDHEIGGTFETFDMSGYETFRHVPVFMNVALNLYYCSRIDYGYVQNNNAYIVFTDKEQRQWMLSLEMGKISLPGTLVRLDRARGGDSFKVDPDYLMPEDAEFYKNTNNAINTNQIVFGLMTEDSDEFLNCLYYYKKTELTFVIPDNIPLDRCYPSRKQCRNFRLAIIGGRPQRRTGDLTINSFAEIQSAFLDDCDLHSGYLRTIQLRDNPDVITGITSELFIATAIIYEDTDMNGTWTHSTEPVLATLDDQLLVFYSTQPAASIYGKSPEEKVYEMPVLTIENIDSETGWHIYNDTSETASHWRILKSLSLNHNNTLTLHPVSKDKTSGCILSSTEENSSECTGILPVLLQ